MKSLASTFLLLALLAPTAHAQDAVTLHSVTIAANNDVTVVWSKNFATCAHLRFTNPTCTQNGALTHVNNWFCTSGTQVSITLPATAFVAGFGPGIRVYMVHGNNSGVFSPCVTVGVNGAYGSGGCVGTLGAPTLTANNDGPPAGSNLDLTVGNGPAGSVAVLGFALGQASIPLFGCTLLIAPPVLVTVAVPLDITGGGTFTFPLPPGSAGAAFTTQAYVLDPSGPADFTATNGRLIRVL
ncbi:MAG: hypothetical protein WAT39_05445 [Planctomycetota bacterium]